jgi:pimeloyl-ACP methyl ester carboxylesterase
MNFWELYQKMDLEKQKANIPICKVLYVGGLSSRGQKANMLRAMGFQVVAPQFPDSVLAIAAGRLAQNSTSWPARAIRTLTGNATEKQFAVLNNIADEASEKFEPDIIIGVSQGGPVAMRLAHKFPKARLFLLAPAWKLFSVAPEVRPDTIVIHGSKDKIIPFSHSAELCHLNNCRLITTDDGHDLIKGQSILYRECLEISKKLKKYPGLEGNSKEQQGMTGSQTTNSAPEKLT